MIPKLELTLQNTIAGAGVFTLGILAGRYWSSAAGTTISGKAVEGLGTIQRNGISVHDFLPNWMIFFHFSSTWFSDL